MLRSLTAPLLLGAALVAPLFPLPAATAQSTEFTLLGYQEGGDFYFMLEGGLVRNPTLVVPPGERVTIVLKTVSGFHNLRVEGFDASDFAGAGETATLEFQAPREGEIRYWCDPHKASGMNGYIRVEPRSEPTPEVPDETGQHADETVASTISLDVTGHLDGPAFRVGGFEDANPVIDIPFDSDVLLRYTTATGQHNLHVEGVGKVDIVDDAAPAQTLSWRADEPGEYDYWCDVHPDQMRGVIRVSDPPMLGGPSPSDDGPVDQAGQKEPQRGTPGAGALLTLLGLGGALAFRRGPRS